MREIALRSKAVLHAVPLAVSMASFTSLNIQKQGCPRDTLQFPVSLNSFAAVIQCYVTRWHVAMKEKEVNIGKFGARSCHWTPWNKHVRVNVSPSASILFTCWTTDHSRLLLNMLLLINDTKMCSNISFW